MESTRREMRHVIVDDSIKSLTASIQRLEELHDELIKGPTPRNDVLNKTESPMPPFQLVWDGLPERLAGATKRIDELYGKFITLLK